MRIERIDESTIKLYVTYSDIEERGFKQDDLWFNKQKGEEFFWKMMDEVNEEEDFMMDGPLWIQIHAFDKGIEVIVTKSTHEEHMYDVHNNGYKVARSNQQSEENKAIDDEMNALYDEVMAGHLDSKEDEKVRLYNKELLMKFNDFEDVIQCSKVQELQSFDKDDMLYVLNDEYYYLVELHGTDQKQYLRFLSIISEYAERTTKTRHYLEDYGKVIFTYNVFRQVCKFFVK